MDVERAIEFILDREARAFALLEEQSAAIKQMREEHRADIKEIRGILKDIAAAQAKTDYKLKLAGNMIGLGMKLLNKLTESQKRLVEAQERTERKVDRVLDALLRQGPNGRPR